MVDGPFTRTEVAVGGFVLAGAAALAYLSLSIGGVRLFPGDELRVVARFASVGALKPKAAVKIAGVRVGEVRRIALEDYSAEVELAVQTRVELPLDTIASIRTEGLLGESYVLLRPGGHEANLAPGGRIAQTEPAVDLIDLVVKYALEKGDEAADGAELPLDPLFDPPGADEDLRDNPRGNGSP